MKKISFEVPEMDDERGVSPVIGVILMVAITVILAAVIASFVLGFGNSMGSNANAGIDVTVNDGNATVTWISQGNAETVNISVAGNDTSVTLKEVGQTRTIGNFSSLDYVVPSGEQTLIVTAMKGETKTVIQKDTIDFKKNTS